MYKVTNRGCYLEALPTELRQQALRAVENPKDLYNAMCASRSLYVTPTVADLQDRVRQVLVAPRRVLPPQAQKLRDMLRDALPVAYLYQRAEQFKFEHAGVETMRLSNDLRWALTEGNCEAKVWDLRAADGAPITLDRDFSWEEPAAAPFAPPGYQALGEMLPADYAWNVDELPYNFDLEGLMDRYLSAAFSLDGRYVAHSQRDAIEVFDLEQRTSTVWRGHEGQVLTVAFSRDCMQLVSAGADRAARVWDVKTGKCIATLLHEESIARAMFSPDRRFVVTAGDASIQGSSEQSFLWTLGGQYPQAQALGGAMRAGSPKFSPDSNILYNPRWDGCDLWDLRASPAVSYRLEEKRENYAAFTSVDFSPDSSFFVASLHTGASKAWDLACRPPRVTVLHDDPTGKDARLRFTPDGRFVTAVRVGASGFFAQLIRFDGDLLREASAFGVNDRFFSTDPMIPRPSPSI